MPIKYLITAALSCAAIYAQGVEVEDRYPISGSSNHTAPTETTLTSQSLSTKPISPEPQPVSNGATNVAELYYQLQVMQQEVLQLRGMIDEQAHQIKKLKQQRLDDYIDLDRRLSQLGQPGSGVNNRATTNTSSPASSRRKAVSRKGSELQSYRAATDLLLKQQKYDQAADALNQHLKDYPNGKYAANAQYWLGEISLLKSELDVARQWFAKLLNNFPTHSKVPDAQFKLGKVYHLLGDAAKAKEFLSKAASSNSTASGLAQDYLKINFPS